MPSDPADIVAVNATIDLNSTVEYDAATGEISLHFFYKDADGNGISLTKNPVEVRYYVSELALDPSDPTGKDDPGLAWNQLLSERGTPSDPESQLPGLLTVIDGTTGEYRYKFAETVPANSNVIRVTMRARARVSIDGTNYYLVQNANASYDFLQSNAGLPLEASGADMVDTNACNSCHGVRIGSVGHGGGYTEVKSCNNCHNLPYQLPRSDGEGDLAYMVHRIHSAGVFEHLGDFSHVTYPQETTTCEKCHNDQAPNAELAFTNPTRRNCGSCHANVNFETGENHAGGVFTDDTLCSACHQKTGSSINGGIPGNDHKSMIAGSGLAPKPENVSEFNTTITMTPPANGSFYEAGEHPVVTVRLTSNDGGPAANYTAPKDVSGTRDGMLSGANLYVYGPRNDAMPVLTTGSTTDPAWDPATAPTQGHALFTGGTDPLVVTDATGYKYQLSDHIGDLEPGTYMVRFEGNDYGAISDEDYVTASTAVITFQVGQDEVEPKLSGSACLNCHGDTIMHLEGAHPHHQGFDTDGCLACHDGTANYGNYIGNRVHAVHGATLTGDLGPHAGGYDWTHVTFPQDVNNCQICHTNPDADPPVWRTIRPVACAGCHGSDPNSSWVFDDGRGSEAVAASHMILQGADFSDQEQETPGCLVCHGEGQEKDLYKVHGLVNYTIVPEGDD
ncbi:MAG: hypothetical protein LJE59_00940 [Chromatiaceae bacterium]|nr:hypothetical protein [Chromatiaceae bacterium]